MNRKQIQRILCAALSGGCIASSLIPSTVLARTEEEKIQADTQSSERVDAAKLADISGTGSDFNHLIDESRTSFWDGGAAPGYFILDLKQAYRIDEINAQPLIFSDHRYYNYEIHASLDNLNYTKIADHQTGQEATEEGDTITFDEPVTARFIKVIMTYDSGNPSVHMCGIHVYGVADPNTPAFALENLALNKKVYTTGQRGEVITDGKLDAWTFWEALGPASFTIDLEQDSIISCIRAFPFWSIDRYYHYKIYASQDNVTFTKVAEKKDTAAQTAEGDTYTFEEPIKARYIKVTMLENSHNPSVHMNEVQVFGYADPDGEGPIDPDEINKDNIALNKPVHAPQHTSDASKVTDGDALTYWPGSYYPGYVDVDLEQTYALDDVTVVLPAERIIEDGELITEKWYRFSIYGSNDGENFTLLGKKTDQTPADGDGFTLELKQEQYRYIRVYLTDNSQEKAAPIAEVRAHGTATDTNTGTKRTGTIDEVMGIQPYAQTEYAAPITEAETIENVYGIVDRTVGQAYRSWFDFELAPEQENGNDFFDLSMKDGKVHIAGNNGISLAMGLNHYYKYFANVNISEQSRQTKMPESIVSVPSVIHKETALKVRYAFNYCTLSYTFAYFNEEQYQAENDWLALNGVNAVLDLSGQEAVWIKFLQSLGYSVDEAEDWLTGPGYYAWQFMANMENYGGPVNDDWVTRRLEMSRKNQRWKASLGMQTVMQGYGGMVPNNIKEKQPDAVTIDQGWWCGTARPDMIRTDGTLYDDYADKFYEAQKWALGDRSNLFAVDPFHEGGIRPSDLSDDVISDEILNSMLKNNEDAVWLVQCWENNPTAKLLEGMGDRRNDHVMVLDLTAHTGGRHDLTEYGNTVLDSAEFNQTPWIWCALTNYGGNYNLGGNLDAIASKVPALSDSYSSISGIGIISEAAYDTPIVYDMLFEAAWEDEPIDVEEWISSYIRRRYGAESASAREAWTKLQDLYYKSWSQSGDTFAPAWNNEAKYYNKDPEAMVWLRAPENIDQSIEAMELLMEDFDTLSQSEAYLFDLSELMAQIACESSKVAYDNMLVAIQNHDLKSFQKAKEAFLKQFDLMDAIASTEKDRMVGEWIGKAEDWANDLDDFTKEMMSINAKALLTNWFSASSSLIDYVNRPYAGLVMDVNKARWQTYLDSVEDWLQNKGEVAEDNGERLYWNWVLTDQEYSRTPDQSKETFVNLAARIRDEAVTQVTVRENLALNKPVTGTESTNPGVHCPLPNAVDGLDSTFWDGGPWSAPAQIVVDLEAPYTLTSVNILQPLAFGSRSYKYEIYTSLDGQSWSLQAKKDNAEAAKSSGDTYSLNQVNARYIKVVGLYNSANEAFHINEIRAYGWLNQDLAKAELQKLYDENKNKFAAEDYTTSTWSALTEALQQAKTVLDSESVTIESIAEAVSGLHSAVDGLKERANLDELNLLIEMAQKLEEEDYTQESWSRFASSLQSAEAAVQSTDTDREKADLALLSLMQTMHDLEKNPIPVDRSVLDKVLAAAARLSEKDYTPESWSAFVQAKEQAKSVSENEEATQQDVDQAVADLLNRQSVLVLAEVDRSALQKAVVLASAMDLDVYTKESVQAFNQALDQAKTILSRPDAQEAELAQTLCALLEAENALVLKPAAVQTDFSVLEQVIEEAGRLNADDYTSQSWSTFAASLDAARTLASQTEAKQSEINQGIIDLVQAMQSLQKKEPVQPGPEIQKTVLLALIEKASAIDPSQFKEAGVRTLQEALSEARRAESAADSTQKEIDQAAASLFNALSALEEKEKPAAPADRSLLEHALSSSANLKQEDFTPESWKDFAAAKDAAQKILNTQSPSQDQIDDALRTLISARAALLVQEDTPADRSALHAAWKKAQNRRQTMEAEDYVPASLQAFDRALEQAEKLLLAAKADEKQLASAIEALSSTQSGLEQYIYRAYNPGNGEHLFTVDSSEYLYLTQKAGWKAEGAAWVAPADGKEMIRLYNPNTGEHHYTGNPKEIAVLEKAGWQNEGKKWCSASAETGTVIHRLYNPNASSDPAHAAGAHHYTLDSAEKDGLVTLGWTWEKNDSALIYACRLVSKDEKKSSGQ